MSLLRKWGIEAKEVYEWLPIIESLQRLEENDPRADEWIRILRDIHGHLGEPPDSPTSRRLAERCWKSRDNGSGTERTYWRNIGSGFIRNLAATRRCLVSMRRRWRILNASRTNICGRTSGQSGRREYGSKTICLIPELFLNVFHTSMKNELFFVYNDK